MGAPSTCRGHCWDALVTARPHLQAVREKGDGEGVFLTSSQPWCSQVHPPALAWDLHSMLHAVHQELHLLLDAVSPFNGYKAVGQVFCIILMHFYLAVGFGPLLPSRAAN